MRRLLKTAAKPLKAFQKYRRLNSDFEAIQRGTSQKAYPLDWAAMKKRYLKDEASLQGFLKGIANRVVVGLEIFPEAGELAKNVYYKIGLGVGQEKLLEIEKNLGLPKGLIGKALQRQYAELVVKRRKKFKAGLSLKVAVEGDAKLGVKEFKTKPADLPKLEKEINAMVRKAVNVEWYRQSVLKKLLEENPRIKEEVLQKKVDAIVKREFPDNPALGKS